ncbi:unnamed protein product [Closterium sp. NIES-64]|nr:unnamed protein product [Closterium sp. NIES-64]
MTPVPTRASTLSDAADGSQTLRGSSVVLQFGEWGADRYLGKRSGADRGRRSNGGADGGGNDGGDYRDFRDRGGRQGRGGEGRGREGGGGGVLERPARCGDYRAKYAGRSDAFVVIDNGSHRCRIGLLLRRLKRWGGEADPRVDFRSVVGRPRPRSGGERGGEDWGERWGWEDEGVGGNGGPGENGGEGGPWTVERARQVEKGGEDGGAGECERMRSERLCCAAHSRHLLFSSSLTSHHSRLAGDGGGRLVSHPSLPMLVSPISSPSLCTTTHFHLPAASRSQVTVVGDWDPAWPALRTLEFGRQSIRSPFESNVIYNFELMECIFDYAFDRLGVEGGGRVNHPVLLTEAPCAPLYTRGKTAELMFETYGVPALAFGVDGVFSYRLNTAQHHSVPDGLLVNCGHSTTHVMPVCSCCPLSTLSPCISHSPALSLLLPQPPSLALAPPLSRSLPHPSSAS